MNVSKNIIKLEEMLYLFFWGLMLIAKGVGLYDGQPLYKILFIVAILCIAVKMCITEYTVKEWNALFLLGLLMVIVYFTCKEKGIILCIATIIGLKNVSIDRLFRVGAWVWGIAMSGNLIYHLLFMETSGYKVHDKLGLGHIFRWDLGLSHPNVLHISYLTLVAFIIYNLGKNYSSRHLLLLMLGNLLVFMYSVSYTGIIVVTLYLGIAYYVNIRNNISPLEYFLLEMIFPCCLLLSFLSPFILPEKIFNIVNKIFSTRLSLAKYFLVEENIKIFGNNLEKITTYQYTMDNAYVFSFIIYGILVFVLISLGYVATIHHCKKNKKNKELAMITSFLVAGITEPFLFNTSFKNLTLVFVGSYLWYWLADKSRNLKKISIFKLKKKEITLKYMHWQNIKKKVAEAWYNKKKIIILLSCTIGILGGICTIITSEKPKGYIVPRKHTDMKNEETWYLKDEEVGYSDYIIMDYENSETKMQIYEGNIIVVEQIRNCISKIVLISIATGFIYILFEIAGNSKKCQKRE